MTRFTTRTWVNAISLLSMLAAAGVTAESRYTYPPVSGYAVSRTVKYGDLDLYTASGARKLYGRLESMARTVCDARRPYDPEYIKAVIRPCVRSSIASAVRDVNVPLLTAYHQKQVDSRADAQVVAAMKERSQ